MNGANKIVCARDSIVSDGVSKVIFHCRARFASPRADWFGIYWNAVDSMNYRYCRIYAPGLSSGDNLTECTHIRIGAVTGGEDVETISDDIYINTDLYTIGCSVRLRVNDNGAVIEIGDEHIIKTYAAEYEDVKSHTGIFFNGDTDIILASLGVAYKEQPAYSTFATTDDLLAYLSRSSDPTEGVWTFFDKNNDPLRSRIGGIYTIAIVSTGQEYEVIYLAGADDNAESWQPLRIKGRMLPATFVGTYDLVWIQPSGYSVSYISAATVEGALLTLQFPYWKTTIRFRKIIDLTTIRL